MLGVRESIIGKYAPQIGDYQAFIPAPFPPASIFNFNDLLIQKHVQAIKELGILDHIAANLPDKDKFIQMFALKDATESSNIEGTRATIFDAIEYTNKEPNVNLPKDTPDIICYLNTLNSGLEQEKDFPISLNFIRKLHSILMIDARETQAANPGNFRVSQVQVGGTDRHNATYMPPPPAQMNKALGDLEKFINTESEFDAWPLIKAGLMHAQFETIHPFNDGNGRTGRILITIFLWKNDLLSHPVLYLASFFNKFRNLYYDKLQAYHDTGAVNEWLTFFLDGIIDTSKSAVKACESINFIRERDMGNINNLIKDTRARKSTTEVLNYLYTKPIVGIADITDLTKMTKTAGYKIIERLVDLRILHPHGDPDSKYARKWIYKDYTDIFDPTGGNK